MALISFPAAADTNAQLGLLEGDIANAIAKPAKRSCDEKVTPSSNSLLMSSSIRRALAPALA
ncbi:hypothetical protein O9993_22625 [Vibrio lentus]|nr:hypothetical protein [Vibrio lentus]